MKDIQEHRVTKIKFYQSFWETSAGLANLTKQGHIAVNHKHKVKTQEYICIDIFSFNS